MTFAGATAAMPKGTIIYVWGLKKYFILEDDCEVGGAVKEAMIAHERTVPPYQRE